MGESKKLDSKITARCRMSTCSKKQIRVDLLIIRPEIRMANRKRQISKRNLYVILFVLCFILIALPFFVVRFIPSTDLPQHLAQIRLLQDVLKNPHQDKYVVEWFGANTLVYYVLQLNWMIFEPIFTGKMAVLEIMLAWVVAILTLAQRTKHSIYSAIIACVFIFNASLYWGLLNFLIGLPVFVIWHFVVVSYTGKRSLRKQVVITVLITFLLFLAHALWLLFGILHLFITSLRRHLKIKEIAIQCLTLIPIGIYSALWFPRLAAIRAKLLFDTEAHWVTFPWERLYPQMLTDSLLGGLHGPTEVLTLVGIAIWIGFSIATNWKQIRTRTNKEFLYISMLMTLVALFAPEKYVNTIYFATRWAPIVMIFLLLALPPPRLHESILFTSVILILTVLSITTCIFWARFEKNENSGLEESLQRITENANVIGLDFVQGSELICGRPFLQTFAYAQVLHGGGLNFSFAEHHSGILSFARIDTLFRWTPGLEWNPDRVQYARFSLV